MKEFKTTFEELNPEQQKQVQKDMDLAMWDQSNQRPGGPRTGADGVIDATTLVINGYFAYRLTRFATISFKVEQAKKAQ